MKSILIMKKVIKFLLPKKLIQMVKRGKEQREIKNLHRQIYRNWRKSGCPVPPPHVVKQMTTIKYQKKYRYNILIETGTYLGEMIDAQKKNFKQIISIELGESLFNTATAKYKKEDHITIVLGDSGKFFRRFSKISLNRLSSG